MARIRRPTPADRDLTEWISKLPVGKHTILVEKLGWLPLAPLKLEGSVNFERYGKNITIREMKNDEG